MFKIDTNTIIEISKILKIIDKSKSIDTDIKKLKTKTKKLNNFIQFSNTLTGYEK